MSDISNMVSSISRTGIQKLTRYSASITFPTSIFSNLNDGVTTSLSEQIAPRIERVTLPSSNLEQMERPSSYRMSTSVVTSRSTMDPISFSVILSNGMQERRYFEKWQNFIDSAKSSYRPRFYDEYISPTMTIFVMNDESDVLSKYIFVNVYPTSVGDIEFSYSDNDSYASCAITFNYEDWYRVDVNETASSGGAELLTSV